jgi:hypothetical protein
MLLCFVVVYSQLWGRMAVSLAVWIFCVNKLAGLNAVAQFNPRNVAKIVR